MDTNELKHWVAFNCIRNVGHARFALLEGYFGSLKRAWHVGASELQSAAP